MEDFEKNIAILMYRDFKKTDIFTDCLMGLDFKKGFSSYLCKIGVNLSIIDIIKPIFDEEYNNRKKRIDKINKMHKCNMDCEHCSDAIKNTVFCFYETIGKKD